MDEKEHDKDKEKNPRLTVYFPKNVKKQLSQMAEETGLSQTQLVVMATHGLLAQYKQHGQVIFSNIQNYKPED
ncbi:CopG family transcriptional regulator [uncultured Brevibacillus sp.]|uniref:ribbon-helix-helix domain-containing protein n=1 Tax=uncultured Brevibacillus sp. TaxID=169970 RepID=UPI0025957CEA|nr:CopG family transcriptional regulator [uncultured Brevibacillus sp.]